MGTPKKAVLELLKTLPDTASFEEIQYRIYVREKIQRGLDDVQAGRVLTQEELERRLARWLEP